MQIQILDTGQNRAPIKFGALPLRFNEAVEHASKPEVFLKQDGMPVVCKRLALMQQVQVLNRLIAGCMRIGQVLHELRLVAAATKPSTMWRKCSWLPAHLAPFLVQFELRRVSDTA